MERLKNKHLLYNNLKTPTCFTSCECLIIYNTIINFKMTKAMISQNVKGRPREEYIAWSPTTVHLYHYRRAGYWGRASLIWRKLRRRPTSVRCPSSLLPRRSRAPEGNELSSSLPSKPSFISFSPTWRSSLIFPISDLSFLPRILNRGKWDESKIWLNAPRELGKDSEGGKEW